MKKFIFFIFILLSQIDVWAQIGLKKKDSTRIIKVNSTTAIPCFLEAFYVNENHRYTTLNYASQKVEFKTKSRNRVVVAIRNQIRYKNIVKRVFKRKKKRYSIKIGAEAFPGPEKLLENNRHIIRDRNGKPFLSFRMMNGVVIEEINLILPDNKIVFNFLEMDSSHPKVDFYSNLLDIEINEDDRVLIYESFFPPSSDTLISRFYLNGECIYYKHSNHYWKVKPQTNQRVEVELHGNGNIKKIEEEENKKYRTYYKKGDIKTEYCTYTDTNQYGFYLLYYKNGNLKLKQEHFRQPNMNQVVRFRRNGSMHLTYTHDSTYLYNRRNKLIASKGYTKNYLAQAYFVRYDNQKIIIYKNLRRQYKSLVSIKKLPKQSWYWIRKTSRNFFKKLK